MKTRQLPVKSFLYGLLFAIHMVKPGGSSCRSANVATDFRRPSNAVTVSSIIGIPDREQVEIRCECMGGRRPGTPDWTYNDRNVSDGPHNNDEPYVNSDATLRVDSFSEDSSGLYTCHGRDRNMEFNLIWYDPDDRPQLVVEPKKQNIMIRNGNERVTLECIAFGADITWERKSGMIPNKAMLREGGARLEIPNVRRDDDNDYRCIAENRNGQTMSKYVAVSVTEELEIVRGPTDVSRRIGMTVTLTCNSEGFQSENFMYLWTNSLDYPVYRENSSSGISSLVFPAVGPRNSGEYRCIVQNEWGEQVTSRSASVQVEIPESFPPMNMSNGTFDQFSATLNWELSAVDVDLVDRIMIHAQQISLLVYGSGMGRGRRQIAGNTSTVTITDPNATQYTFNDLQPFSQYCFTITALYAFEGQELGEVAAQPFCTNTSEAAPSAPRDVTVVSQGFTSLILTWTTPQSPNGIILNYTIKYNNKVEVVPVDDAMPTFILSQLPEGTNYDISISATNNAGNGIYSNIVTTSTLSRAPTGDAEQLMFQIKLESDHIHFCPTWISDEHRQLIASAVVNFIQMECNCELEQEAVDQEHLLCDQSQPNETVFRAEITTYQLTRDDLLIILQNMITGGKLMINESSFFRLDDSCPVEIASFNDPLCVTPTTKTVKSQETVSNKGGIPTGAIVGSIIAILIIIILMILGILFILYWRNKHRKIITENDPLEVRYNNQTTSMLQTLPQTMPYSSPLPLTSVDNNLQKDSANGSDECLILDKRKIKNTDLPIPYIDFDNNDYLKSVINIAQVKMQPNPSYFKTNIPDNNSTDI